jgi:alpha-beta hydrolase superfamily lysophospholipase
LAGHSLGGLFAIHALINRPELFNACIATSPICGGTASERCTRPRSFSRSRRNSRKRSSSRWAMRAGI